MRIVTLFQVIIYFLFSFANQAKTQIIVDHLAVQEFDQIPDDWIEAAKLISVHYGHTSHGSQILAGLYWIEEYIDPLKYKVLIGPRNETRTPDLPAQTDPISLRIWEEGLWPERTGDRLGYWLGDDALSGTVEVLNSDSFDVSGWAWCGEVSLNEWPYIQNYLNAMTYLETTFPDIRFFYMTGHNVESGPPNHQQIAWDRLRNNNQGIKDHCLENNGILFDFADIETHDPDGNYYPEEDGTGIWCEDWLIDHLDEYPNLPPQVEHGCGVGCKVSAHAHGLFTVMKAKAFWWMMARIAGWPGIRRLRLVEEKAVTAPGNYIFNEHAQGGDGHQIEIAFNNLMGNGNVTVQQTNAAPPGAPGTDVCEIYWDISNESGITDFTADITFHYSDSEAAGFEESNAYFGIAQFQPQTNRWKWYGGSLDETNNTITINKISSFSRFALYRRIFGDITGDGYVNAADLQRLGDCWNDVLSGEFSPGTDSRFFNMNKNNTDYNQVIDEADLDIFQDCWHNGIKP
jgi:hypothetical protein